MILRLLIAFFGLGVLSVGAGMFLFVGPDESEIPFVTLEEFERDPDRYGDWIDLTGFRLGQETFLVPNPMFEGEEFAERAIPLRPIGTDGNDQDATTVLLVPGLDESTIRMLYEDGTVRMNRSQFLQSLDAPMPEQIADLQSKHPEYQWSEMTWVSDTGTIGPIGPAIPVTAIAIGLFLVFAAIVLMRKKQPRVESYDDDWDEGPRTSPPPLR